MQATNLKDYQTPDFLIESCALQFELEAEKTLVYSQLKMRRNMQSGHHVRPLILQGENLKLLALHIDDEPLFAQQYEITPHELIIASVPDQFTLDIVTEIYPHKNTALKGLYTSEKMYCTQCEAEGFRNITYYLDRPDVMTDFTTTIVADKTKYPVLLSNGNLIEKGEREGGKHWVKWHDPFKKPSYLFALVAGDLLRIEDSFTTQSGRKVALEIYVEPENIKKCDHAMYALKAAMAWDEKVYGREYDLDIYMIVAVNDFNMGAMENKGLNIFNAKYVLADTQSATDTDFQAIEAVIGHEYFHNWSGNRVTCRDWFQLSLKEGLTVFREQQFSAFMGSAAVKRINDVKAVRTRQFAEDAGPMAHPVQPGSYIEINNFYTMTIYYKGGEVIRMLRTLLGEKGFRKGMDLYFERHDGQAVTIEDFVAALSDANDYDLTQFYRWYHQAGTPEVKARGEYDANKKQFTLHLTQSCAPTPDNSPKEPFFIPIKIGLYDKNGNKMANTQEDEYIVLKEASQQYIFNQIESAPIPSLLGDFSAPVKLDYPYSTSDLVLLMIHDKDSFNRWDAAQRICIAEIKILMQAYAKQETQAVSPALIEAYKALLQQPITDPNFLAQMLIIPSFNYIAEMLPVIDVDALKHARKILVDTLAKSLEAEYKRVYEVAAKADTGDLSGISMGYRALKNTCLWYCVKAQEKNIDLAQKQYQTSRNMTDTMGALSAVNITSHTLRQQLFDNFYTQWEKNPLVVNKWLSLQAMCDASNTLENIKALLSHPGFDMQNPNKVYALINTFGASNPECFHDKKGLGYDFLADCVITLDRKNPQVAARVLESLTSWKRLDAHHGNLMKNALMKIQKAGDLSSDVFEIITKSLL